MSPFFSVDDELELRRLRGLCRAMSQIELERFCEGTLRAATEGQRVFRERFPEAWQDFDRRMGGA